MNSHVVCMYTQRCGGWCGPGQSAGYSAGKDSTSPRPPAPSTSPTTGNAYLYIYTHLPYYNTLYTIHFIHYIHVLYRYFPYAQLDNLTGLPLANMANPDEGFADDDNDDKASRRVGG